MYLPWIPFSFFLLCFLLDEWVKSGAQKIFLVMIPWTDVHMQLVLWGTVQSKSSILHEVVAVEIEWHLHGRVGRSFLV